MKKIKTINAVGHILCHDVTQIIKNLKAGPLFKKGHIVREEDIEKLLLAGKDHLYIYEIDKNLIHENEAAQILYELCASEKVTSTEVNEGKIEILANIDGLLKINTKQLQSVNELDDIIIATLHQYTIVKKGDKIAGTRIIPLMIAKTQLQKAKKLVNGEPLLNILPLHIFKIGVIIIGNEIYYERIKDTFTPVIKKKLEEYNLKIDTRLVVKDDIEAIKSAIFKCKEQGMQLIICTAGMSVDPDDLTASAIKEAVPDIFYGIPALPGAMLLIGYFKDETPILGLPACVMYSSRSSFDLMFPRILAKDKITKKELATLGHGGLCLKCLMCVFPNCRFGSSSSFA